MLLVFLLPVVGTAIRDPLGPEMMRADKDAEDLEDVHCGV